MSVPHNRMFEIIEIDGGPLDGSDLPNVDHYYAEQDIVNLPTREHATRDPQWFKESVYEVINGKLVYRPDLTSRRAAASKETLSLI